MGRFTINEMTKDTWILLVVTSYTSVQLGQSKSMKIRQGKEVEVTLLSFARGKHVPAACIFSALCATFIAMHLCMNHNETYKLWVMKLQTTYQLITPVLTVPHILFVMTFKLHRVFLCKCERFHTSVRWNYRCWPLIVNGREEDRRAIRNHFKLFTLAHQ